MRVAPSPFLDLAFACALLCAAAAPAAAQAPAAEAAAEEPGDPPAQVQATYRDVVARAIAEFDAKHFAEARSLFLRAHELWPSARTLRTLGMTAFELRMYPQALEELQAALDDSRRRLPDAQRAQVLSLVEQTRAFVGRYRVQISPAEAELLVDGAPQPASDGVAVVVLAVGEHALLARAKGHGELRRALVVQGREDEELALSLDPIAVDPPVAVNAPAVVNAPITASSVQAAEPTRPVAPRAEPRSPNRVAAITVLSVGAAGLITSGIFAGLALSKKSDLKTECPNHECPPESHSKNDDALLFANVATVGFAIGAVGAAIGAYLWFTAKPSSQSDHAARVEPWIGLRSSGVAGTF